MACIDFFPLDLRLDLKTCDSTQLNLHLECMTWTLLDPVYLRLDLRFGPCDLKPEYDSNNSD